MAAKKTRRQPVAGRLDGKVAVITGGASGMGRATALRFLAEGASVVIADMNEGTAKEALEAAAKLGAAARAAFVRTNVADEDDVAAAVERAVDEFGGIDCMFNNAGIGGALGSLLELEVEDWDATCAVLLRGVFLGIKHAGRAMKHAGRGGSIVNTASIAGLSGGAGPACYSACKAGVINLTRAAALELAPLRIRVNAICPGGVLTPLLHRGHEEVVRQRLDKLQPWPSHGRGEHIANAALFLASDESEFVTGEALVVDGGLMAAGPAYSSTRREPVHDDISSHFDFVGLDWGSTGKAAVVRKLAPKG
jgi:NAD(P)-dependent dehydrogenase (short-subunit alcohol dehydrogenase family)